MPLPPTRVCNCVLDDLINVLVIYSIDLVFCALCSVFNVILLHLSKISIVWETELTFGDLEACPGKSLTSHENDDRHSTLWAKLINQNNYRKPTYFLRI